MKKNIEVINANENNLNHVSVDIPLGTICGICGVSGSGKSTLAKEVIARTGIMNFANGLPYNLKKRIFDGKYPDVSAVNNLPPVYLINIKNSNRSIRSTVATVSGLMGIIRNIYCLTSTDSVEPRLFSYNILIENGGGACPNCVGTGSAETVNINLISGNKQKSVLNGGFKCVNQKGIKHTKVTEKLIGAFCAHHHISLESPLEQLSKNELNLLLYGSEDLIHFVDNTGANGGKKTLQFNGIVGTLLDVYRRTHNDSISRYVEKCACPICNGSRYNDMALKNKYLGKNISEFLQMSISDSVEFINQDTNQETVGLISEYLAIAKELIGIGVGYLSLDRTVSSISGGELQRIKLAKCLSNEIYDSCFILDEPSSGLHATDIDKVLQSIKKLNDKGNTVVVVEHNDSILRNCDYIIEMGESGGKNGGNITFAGDVKEYQRMRPEWKTGLSSEYSSVFGVRDTSKRIDLYSIYHNNIHGETISIPLNAFTTVVGVSGSGKSTAINSALYDALVKNLEGVQVPNLIIQGKVQNVVSLSQDQGVTNSRSIVATYLGLMDFVRDLYASLEDSQSSGYDRSYFSINSGKGLCNECRGAGAIKDEDDELEEICPTCQGKRFIGGILDVRFKGYNIIELLGCEISTLCDLLRDDIDTSILERCCNIGVGYLSLDRPMPSLSKGEYQRLRIAKEISNSETKNTVFILDEPSKGLHYTDLEKIILSINELVEKGNTVIAIEHNMYVVNRSDFVIELGPGAGEKGGKILFSGSSRDFAALSLGQREKKQLIQSELKTNCQGSNNCIEFSYNNQNVRIIREKINVVSGGIGSGKSILADNVLFSYPYRKYISMISSQGKYLTKDIEVKDVGCNVLPLSRIISPTMKYYTKYERISETINLDYYMSRLFYNSGIVKCSSCGNYTRKIGNYDACQVCGDTHRLVMYPSSFSFGKKSCKCPVCKGKGRLKSYDFDKIMHTPQLKNEMMRLLADRTRFDRITPLLKSEYGLDLKKDYDRMSDEEKRVFLYGDVKKEVLYLPKNKTYYWTGCNELINSNIRYCKSDDFVTVVEKTYLDRVCPECGGNGFESCVLDVKYKNFMFSDLISSSIKDVYTHLSKELEDCGNQKLLEILKVAVDLGLGEVKLNSYTADLPITKKSVAQYIKYKFSPINNTALIWDDFLLEKNSERVIHSLNEDLLKGVTVILFVQENTVEHSNSVTLKAKYNLKYENGINIETRDIESYAADDYLLDKLDMVLYSKTTIGSVSGIVADIRNIFRNKEKKYSYTLPEDQCEFCDGKGKYEINYGLVGYQKRDCGKCDGTGYRKELQAVKVDGYSFQDLVFGTIDEIYDWLVAVGKRAASEKIKIFKELGLGYLRLNQGLDEMSYNESSMVLIVKLIRENKGHSFVFQNFFLGLSEELESQIIGILDRECSKNNCRLRLKKY